MDRLIQSALKGNPVAWFSPTYKLQSDTWRELRSTLAPVTRDRSEQEKRLELINGGVVELWSLDSPDSGRGRKYATAIVDEAAMIPTLEQSWQQSIRPTLTDLQGSAWFLSTPRGLNFFKFLFDCGQDDTRRDWASWQMPTSTNPFINPEEIQTARLDLTEAAFNQEYLALFVNWEGSVFRRVSEATTAARRMHPEKGHDYVIGIDWGRSNDYTVFVVLDTSTRHMVAMDRSNRVDYSVQRDRLRALCERWQPTQIIAEQNSIGQPVIEQLMRDGLRIQPFTTTHASKVQAVEALALAFERGDIHILDDAVLVSELVAYQAERLPSGLMRYGAPSGQHDDCVMALAIAWTAVSGQNRVVYPVPESNLIVEPFNIPLDWPRAYGLAVGSSSVAAIYGALDRKSGILYLHAEYFGVDSAPSVHAQAIRSLGLGMPGVIAPEGNGRNQIDGYRVINMYRALGLDLHAAEDLVDSGTLEVWQRMSEGRLKAFSSLAKYWEELRFYRRSVNGQIVTEDAHLQNATRCLVVTGIDLMRRQARRNDAELSRGREIWYRNRGSDGLGWMNS